MTGDPALPPSILPRMQAAPRTLITSCRRALPALTLVILLTVGSMPVPAATPTDATHPPASLPIYHDDPAVNASLRWIAEPPGISVGPDGCVRDEDRCYRGTTKLVVTTLAHVGVDPHTWPRSNGSVMDWMLQHAGDMRDTQLQRCEDEALPTEENACMSKRVHSLSKTLLAFRAAGYDPRTIPLPHGGTRDLVNELLANRTADQFGSPTYVNDDIWAIIALHAAGYEGPEVQESIQVVEDAQHDDGGVGYVSDAKSVDTTAAAIMALAPHHRHNFTRDALGYLRSTQIANGTEAGCWGQRGGERATAGSTAWALQALVAASASPTLGLGNAAPWNWTRSGQDPATCLRTFQAQDGGFRNSLRDGQDRPILQATYQATAALAWTPYGDLREPLEPLAIHRTVRAGHPLEITVQNTTLLTREGPRNRTTLHPTTPGNLTLQGFTWQPSPARRVDVHVQVLPGLPNPPSLDAATEQPHHEPLEVTLQPGDDWATTLHLRLPNGTNLTGPHHILHLPPGTHELRAWSRNALGEASKATSFSVHITNAPPHLTLEGPTTANRTGPVTLHAEATDPEADPVDLTWTLQGEPAGTGPNLTLEPGPPGPVHVTVTARDAWNATTTRSWNLTWHDTPPEVELDVPDPLVVGSTNLTGTARDPDGDPVTLRWLVDGEPAGEGAIAEVTLEPGNHTLHVTAWTPHGATNLTRTLTVPAAHADTGNATAPPATTAPEPDPSPPPDPSNRTHDEGNASAATAGDPARTPGPGSIVLATALAAAAHLLRRSRYLH